MTTNERQNPTIVSRFHNFLLIVYRRNKLALAGLIFLLSLVVVGVFAPWIIPYGPFDPVGRSLVPPNSQFYMGTDDLGRDILSGIVYGSKASLLVGFLSTVISVGIGVLIGGISGYFGGTVDNILMRFTEVFQVLPTFVLALTILALFSPSFSMVIFAIAIVSWPTNARLVRGKFLSVKEEQFVTAAKATGMGNLRIIFSEILPNVIPILMVNSALQVGNAITAEAGLGFLGLSDPEVMTWGLILGNARAYLRSAWWMMTFPGLMILFTILALRTISDAINLALNPRRERY